MKKLFLFPTIVFALFFFTNCQQEVLDLPEDTPTDTTPGNNGGVLPDADPEVRSIVIVNQDGSDIITAGDNVSVTFETNKADEIENIELQFVIVDDGAFIETVRTELNPPYVWGMPVTNQDFLLNNVTENFELDFVITKKDGTTEVAGGFKVDVLPAPVNPEDLVEIKIFNRDLFSRIFKGDDVFITYASDNPAVKEISFLAEIDDALLTLIRGLQVSTNAFEFQAEELENIQDSFILVVELLMEDGAVNSFEIPVNVE